jgi:hypothetical protein
VRRDHHKPLKYATLWAQEIGCAFCIPEVFLTVLGQFDNAEPDKVSRINYLACEKSENRRFRRAINYDKIELVSRLLKVVDSCLWA